MSPYAPPPPPTPSNPLTRLPPASIGSPMYHQSPAPSPTPHTSRNSGHTTQNESAYTPAWPDSSGKNKPDRSQNTAEPNTPPAPEKPSPTKPRKSQTPNAR